MLLPAAQTHGDQSRRSASWGDRPGISTRTAPSVRRVRLPTIAGISDASAQVLGALDDLIENNRRRVEVLEEMARAIYREWFVHFRYPGHESAALRRFRPRPDP